MTSKEIVMILEIPDFDDETLQLAYDELLSFLQKSHGITPAGCGNLKLDFQINSANGYSVSFEKNRLVFAAPTSVEILYAVYHFAEAFLGFCFFEPGNDRLEIKNEINLSEGILIPEQIPVLKNRGFIQEYPYDESNFILGDWMAKNRMNYLLVWMTYYDDFPNELLEYYRIRGITVESGHHNFEYLIPSEKYAEPHPEYFAVVDGERSAKEKHESTFLLGKQLCVSNPELRSELTSQLVLYAEKHPELKYISLIPNDGFGWCECEECSKFYDKTKMGDLYSVSRHVYRAEDIYHDFVADIVSRVRKVLPDLTITFGAYINYVTPSKSMKLTPGTAVHVAPYWRCVNHLIDDPSCPINSKYHETLKKWAAVKQGGEFNIYEYYMGVNMYVSLPIIHHSKLIDEIDAFKDLGVDGLLTQYWLSHWTAYGLNYYVMAKAAYGEGQASVPIALQRIFGKDAELADKFYKALDDIVQGAGECHITLPVLLFARTRLEQYQVVRTLAVELGKRRPDDMFCQNLILWMDYLIIFKTLFDRYHCGEDVKDDIHEFMIWAKKQSNNNIVVLPMLKKLISKWLDCIEHNRDWLHFNIDWEDEYIISHLELLKL